MNLKQLASFAVDRIEKGASSQAISQQLAAALLDQRS
jgi:hypothetical protein